MVNPDINPDLQIGTQFDDYAFHLGSHPDYTRKMKDQIGDVQRQYHNGTISKAEALEDVIEIAENAKNAIRNNKGIKINDLDF